MDMIIFVLNVPQIIVPLSVNGEGDYGVGVCGQVEVLNRVCLLSHLGSCIGTCRWLKLLIEGPTMES